MLPLVVSGLSVFCEEGWGGGGGGEANYTDSVVRSAKKMAET
jgi:hypothetical protein